MIKRLQMLFLYLGKLIGYNSPEAQFKSAFSVFQKEQAYKRKKQTSKLHSDRAQVGTLYARTGKGDPVTERYRLYKEHAELIGKDFMDSFYSIIVTYCSSISDDSKILLLKDLSQIYNGAMNNARSSDSRYLAGIDRPDQLDSFYPPTEGFYKAALSSYTELLQSEISKCNLKVSHTKLESRRQQTIALILQIISYVVTFIIGFLFGKWLA